MDLEHEAVNPNSNLARDGEADPAVDPGQDSTDAYEGGLRMLAKMIARSVMNKSSPAVESDPAITADTTEDSKGTPEQK